MTPRQASRAADIFTALVIASVAISLGVTTWHLLGASSAKPASAPVAAAPGGPVDIAPALALAPFGQPDASSAPPTSLALQLRGIILADPASASSALIAPTGGQPVAYGVGQSVPGGATIEAIAFDTVLLRTNGRLERLDLPRISANGQAPAAAAPPPPGAVPATGPSDGSGSQPLQAFTPGSPSPGAPAGGPLSLLDRLGAAPVGGAYRVGTSPSPEARDAGLLPGDVIERINGMPATAVAADRQLLAQIMAAGPAQVEVVRGGKRVTFSFALR